MFRIVALAAALALSAGPAAAYDCGSAAHEAATRRITILLGTGLLQNASGASVFVSDAYWNRMTYPEKQRFAEQFSCAIAGVGNGLSSWRFRSLRTGNTIGTWDLGTLRVH